MGYVNKAMVLGTNYYIGLSLARGLGKMGVPVVAVNYSKENPYGRSKYVSEELIVPHYKSHPQELCDFLIECQAAAGQAGFISNCRCLCAVYRSIPR